jgi:3-deoxy-D-manno-octulosonate 8-phosphate phosphatase (KDO 8-P phosphatase)
MAGPPRTDTQIAADIRCIVSDVDGCMTDGGIIYDGGGVETKRFHVHDGLGIKLWCASGFQFGIVTSRTSPMVTRRADELGLKHVRQGCPQKHTAVLEMIAQMGCRPDQACYLGDDLPDLPPMREVALAVAPADASTDVQAAAHWILRCRGGEGAVRELAERLLRAKQRWEEHVPG